MVTVRNLMITSWLWEPGEPSLQPGVPGLRIVGWWRSPDPSLNGLRRLQAIWGSENATVRLELDILEDADERKHQICAYIRIKHYPANWLQVIQDSLKLFVQNGASIAWVGGWESMSRLSSDSKFEACYAAFTAATGFICLSDLDEQIETIDRRPDLVQALRAALGFGQIASG